MDRLSVGDQFPEEHVCVHLDIVVCHLELLFELGLDCRDLLVELLSLFVDEFDLVLEVLALLRGAHLAEFLLFLEVALSDLEPGITLSIIAIPHILRIHLIPILHLKRLILQFLIRPQKDVLLGFLLLALDGHLGRRLVVLEIDENGEREVDVAFFEGEFFVTEGCVFVDLVDCPDSLLEVGQEGEELLLADPRMDMVQKRQQVLPLSSRRQLLLPLSADNANLILLDHTHRGLRAWHNQPIVIIGAEHNLIQMFDHSPVSDHSAVDHQPGLGHGLDFDLFQAPEKGAVVFPDAEAVHLYLVVVVLEVAEPCLVVL
jgi:hypothetical protein